jgi:hypothetical protein
MNDNIRTKLRGQDHSEYDLELHDNNDLRKIKDESIEVSYSVLMVDKHKLQNHNDIFQKIATILVLNTL